MTSFAPVSRMSLNQRQPLDRRYSELAGHLKACWVFDQFHHRLRRRLSESDASFGAVDFGEAYRELKEIAAGLDTLEHEVLAKRLDDLELRLGREAARLREQDSRLSAADLRRFVGRVRRLDEELLFELLRFYILTSRGRSWDVDLTDKVDFLLSRLGEEISGAKLSQDRVRLKAGLVSLWNLTQTSPPKKAVVSAIRDEISGIAAIVTEVANLEELEAKGTVHRYRKLKHGLGPMLLEPSVAQAVLDTNAAMGWKVQQLCDQEEWKIARGFSRLDEIGESAGLAESLGIELESLRFDLERLEEGRRHDDMRIAAVRRVTRLAEAILPRLDSAHSEAERQDTTKAERTPSIDLSPEVPKKDELRSELLEKLFGQLETLLAASGSVEEAEGILQDPGLSLGLERREVEAFLLLRDDASPDPEIDRTLLAAASLRLRLSILHDHLEAGASGLAELEAAAGLELAEEIIEWLRSLILDLESGGASEPSSDLRLLRALLMQAYASLWLEIYAGR
jgi:hypothetical protein